MKKLLLSICLLLSSIHSFSQVGLGTSNPISSAALDVTSVTKGFLPPRMTYAQISAIVAPVAGLIVWCTNCSTSGELVIYNGSSWTNLVGGASASPFSCGVSTVSFVYNGATVTYGTVQRAYGGAVGTKCWLDRNLGASQVAQSNGDYLSYGDKFQWGRKADGHQLINNTISASTPVNGTTAIKSDVPNNNLFITDANIPSDWRINPSSTLWAGVSSVNNPCPSGYRVPTQAEFEAEIVLMGDTPTANFDSPLKFPSAGYRNENDGNVSFLTTGGDASGGGGQYWTSNPYVSVAQNEAQYLEFSNLWSPYAGVYNISRAFGASVRCIKD
jgi:uncharacterized protein (TIGR02145 family)